MTTEPKLPRFALCARPLVGEVGAFAVHGRYCAGLDICTAGLIFFLESTNGAGAAISFEPLLTRARDEVKASSENIRQIIGW